MSFNGNKRLASLFLVVMLLAAQGLAGDTAVFDGVLHKALGKAQLAVEGETLFVHGIGSSGQDGVAVLPGEAQAVTITHETIDPFALPTGAGIISTVVGQVNGKPDLQISRLAMTDIGNDIQFWCEWLLPNLKNEMTARAVITLGGQEVATIEDLQGPIAWVCDPIPFPRQDPVWPRWPRDPNDIWMMVEFGEPMPTFLPALDKTVTADGLSIQLINTGARIDNITEIQVNATGMDHFGIVRQEVAMNNLLHTGLGDVNLKAESGSLILDSFSPSGEEGFSVDLTGSTYYYADIAPLCLDRNGASLNFESTGTMDGKEDVFLGSASLQNKDGALFIHADYTPIGSEQVQVYVVNNGRVIAKPILDGGVVGRIPNPTRITGCGKWDPTPILPCYILDFEKEFVVQLNNGQSYEATGLRVITTQTAGALEGLNSFSARATGIETLMIQGESVQAPRREIRFKN